MSGNGTYEAQVLRREHAHQADRSQRHDAEQGRAKDEGRGDRAEQYPCNDYANDGHAGLFQMTVRASGPRRAVGLLGVAERAPGAGLGKRWPMGSLSKVRSAYRCSGFFPIRLQVRNLE